MVQISLAASGEREADSAKLTLSDSLIGHLTDELLSNGQEDWGMLFGNGGLKPDLESK